MSGNGEEWGRSDRPLEDVERDVDDEIAFHVAMRARENAAHGMDPAAARAQAERRFGNVEGVRRELARAGRSGLRARSWRNVVGNVLLDLRLASRALRRRPVFMVVTSFTLALGIGASVAVYSVANHVLLRPVPGVRAPDSLVTVTIGTEEAPEQVWTFGHAIHGALRANVSALEGLAASQAIHASVARPGTGLARRVSLEYVSGDFAEVLGLRARAGRVVQPSDGASPYVAMISDRLWSTLFDRSRDAVGATLSINGTAFIVVGVASRDFAGMSLLNDVSLWVPVEAHAALFPTVGPGVLEAGGYPIWMKLVGRLGPDGTPGRAGAQLDAVVRNMRTDPANLLPASALVRVRPGIGMSPAERAEIASVFRVLGTAAGLLLLLACANAANLMLARTGARAAELQVRRAIGAGRARVVRLLLSEAMVLVVIAGAAGMALAAGALRLFDGARLLTFMPPLGGVELDRRVLLFALGASALTGALAGGVPALMGSGRRADELRSGRRNVRATGPSSVLVVAQVALSAVLLVSSALLVRTLRAIGSTDLGFEPHATLEASVDPGAHGMDAQRRTALLDDLRRRAATIPGVNAAGLSWTPVLGQGQRSVLVRPPGAGPDGPATLTAQTNQVSPGFIAAIGAELIAGRDFTEGDIASAALRPTTAGVSGLAGVAILGESAARRLFADRPAVGRTVVVGQSERTLEVAGVIRDARLADLKEPNVALILEPFGQTGQPGRATLYVRGRTGSLPPLDALRSVLYDIDPTLPFYDMQPLSRRVAAAAVMERMLARLTTAFAVVALVLATVGLYGMMAMLVQGRRREMGVRLALGARPASVRGLVLGRGMRLAALGLGLGLVASTQTGRVLSARLWGVQPLDPVAFCAAAVVLGLAALVACWAPAVRATRVDPVDVLAAE